MRNVHSSLCLWACNDIVTVNRAHHNRKTLPYGRQCAPKLPKTHLREKSRTQDRAILSRRDCFFKYRYAGTCAHCQFLYAFVLGTENSSHCKLDLRGKFNSSAWLPSAACARDHRCIASCISSVARFPLPSCANLKRGPKGRECGSSFLHVKPIKVFTGLKQNLRAFVTKQPPERPRKTSAHIFSSGECLMGLPALFFFYLSLTWLAHYSCGLFTKFRTKRDLFLDKECLDSVKATCQGTLQ